MSEARERRVGVYLRISNDPDGTETATARQEVSIREAVEREGGGIITIYRDRDISAYSGVTRPAFQQLLADAQAGELDAIRAWKWDRFTRNVHDFSALIQAAEAGGCDVNTVADPVDYANPASGLLQLVSVGIANAESRNTSARIRARAEADARAGKPAPSRYRTFGYERPLDALVPDEAEVVREVAARLLDGDSLTAVARDLNGRGVTTTSGGTWDQSNLRRLVQNPTIAGLRGYKGEVYESDVIPAIISREDWERITTMLRDPKRSNRGPGERMRPLSGIVRCGACGNAMRVRNRRSEGRPPGYACARKADGSGCNGCAIAAEPLEELVRDAMAAATDGRPLAEALGHRGDAEEAALVERLEQLRATRDEVEAMLARGDITSDRFLRIARQNDDERLEVEGELARLLGHAAIAGIRPAETVLDAWEDRDSAFRRAIARALIDRIIIGAGVRGRTTFDRDRVEIVWRS